MIGADMMCKIVYAILLGFTTLAAQDLPKLRDIYFNDLTDTLYAERTIYTLDTRFNRSDTVLFAQKVNGMGIHRVDSINVHELALQFTITPGFYELGGHQVVVLDSLWQEKYRASITVRYSQTPQVDSLLFKSYRHSRLDTLVLSPNSKNVVRLCLKGKGLFTTSRIHFEDPAFRVLDGPGWRMDFPPDSLLVGLEVDGDRANIGEKRYRLVNEYSLDTYGRFYTISDRPPRVTSQVPSLVADGNEKVIRVNGQNFQPGLQAELIPPQASVSDVRVLDRQQIEVALRMPVLENSASFRLALTNPDGKSDTTRYFTVRSLPVSRARVKTVQDDAIFLNKKVRVAFVVETTANRKLYPDRDYQVRIEGQRFPVVHVIDDSTFESIIQIPQKQQTTLLNQHVFTVHQVDHSASWKGVLYSKEPPEITYVSLKRTLHPIDTLQLVIKGHHLQNVALQLDEPDVRFDIIENRGDFIRAKAIAGENVTLGSYPLILRLESVRFRFEEFRLQIQPWQAFHEYVGIEIESLGFLSADRLWQQSGLFLPIEVNDAITIKFFTSKIREELGSQKVHVSGVLMDSTNTIKAEAYDNRVFMLEKSPDIVTWRWRVRERMHSGDRIEITLSNSGGKNRATETFIVKRHWSESFRGSTSFILFKVPFGDDEAQTEILKSVGLGISYQPYAQQEFIAFDASFILGNAASSDHNLSVQAGLGLSAILWKHLQIGIGTNLTGTAFRSSFLFVGTRFKLPIPW
jgi:hypothetical protein